MNTIINPIRLRRVMGKDEWQTPFQPQPFAWMMVHKLVPASILVFCWDEPNGSEWLHASIAWHDHLPSYENLSKLHRAVWGDEGYSYQQFVPKRHHFNLHKYALHLWGRADGKPVLPTFEGSM